MLASLSHINPYLAVFVAGLLPIVEVRGAIPLGLVGYGLPIWPVVLISIAGNLVPVVILLWLLEPLTRWLRSLHHRLDRWFGWLFARTHHRHSASFERWGSLFLMLFVAIPLPLTGAWTGTLLAYLFGIKFRHALLYITLGALIASLIMTLVGVGGITAFRAIM